MGVGVLGERFKQFNKNWLYRLSFNTYTSRILKTCFYLFGFWFLCFTIDKFISKLILIIFKNKLDLIGKKSVYVIYSSHHLNRFGLVFIIIKINSIFYIVIPNFLLFVHFSQLFLDSKHGQTILTPTRYGSKILEDRPWTLLVCNAR